MRAFTSLLVISSLAIQTFMLAADTSEESTPSVQSEQRNGSETRAITVKALEPFTAKITKNKVRVRLQPNFDSQSIRELNKDQLVVVAGDADDFYAIQPLADMKAYVFRTYVLDNVVEGTRVNVRLKPDMDAPVLAQLNSGDRVEGKVYGANNKWLEITIPASTRFYIAKEYLEKVGDASYIERMEKRKEEVYRLLNTNKSVADAEIQKPFNQINLEGIVANYQRIILDFKDFPEAGAKAQEYLNNLQEAYTKKKMAYLENQAQQSSQQLEQKNKKLSEELQEHKKKLSELEQQVQKERGMLPVEPEMIQQQVPPSQLPYNMASWVKAETAIFDEWSKQTGKTSPQDFYEDQKLKSFTIKGVVDAYNRPVKNKPGDYMLINSSSKLPIAFLYSTQVNLQNYIGHEVNVTVVPRPNFNYAFPAYFVISVD